MLSIFNPVDIFKCYLNIRYERPDLSAYQMTCKRIEWRPLLLEVLILGPGYTYLT